MSDLPADMHPDRMTACFRTAGSAGLPGALRSEPRFASRLADLVGRHYDLVEVSEDDGDKADHLLAGLSLRELDRLASRAGVVLRARDFLREIRGPMLAAFAERFSADALEDARRHFDLAPDRQKAGDLDGLTAAVEQDGLACLAAWIAALPEPLSRRVRLKWPNDAAVPTTDDMDIIKHGPVIMRRLAANASPSR